MSLYGFINVRTIEVDVVQAELAETLVELLLDVLRRMVVIPELRRDEELFALHDIGNDTLQGGTDFVLVLIDQSTVDVPVACADGNFDLYRVSS